MQYRMKTHQLSQNEIDTLMEKGMAGTLATVDPTGAPYSVPVHFVYLDGAVYFHGLPSGQKLDNLKADPRVCFNVYEMKGLLFDPNEKPCDTNTSYVSAVIRGSALMLEETAEKRKVLSAVVKKYTPRLSEKEIPENMVKNTAVVKITIEKITGKYF